MGQQLAHFGRDNKYFYAAEISESRDLLGEGASGFVFKGYRKFDRHAFAVKRIPKKTPNPFFLLECETLLECRHPNVVKIEEIVSDHPEFWFLVSEFCPGGNLRRVLNRGIETQGLQDPAIWSYLLDILSGLDYLHTREKPIILRDFRPSNVVVSSSGLKISGFGHTRFTGEGDVTKLSVRKGANYCAPEVREAMANGRSDCRFSRKADLFSVGAMLYEMLYRAKYYEDGLGKKLRAGFRDADLINRSLADICRRLLSQDPRNRPSAAECLQHSGFVELRLAARGRRSGSGSGISFERSVFECPLPASVFRLKKSDFSHIKLLEGHSNDDSLGIRHFVASRRIRTGEGGEEGEEEVQYVSIKEYDCAILDSHEVFFEHLWKDLKRVEVMESVKRYPTVARTFGAYLFSGCVGIVSAHNFRNLDDLLRCEISTGKTMSFRHRVRLLLGIATGMQILSRYDMIHRNLCPKNVLIDRDANCAVVSGFVMTSYDVVERARRDVSAFSSCYQAPEVISGGEWSWKADCFSFGMIMFAVLVNPDPSDEFPEDCWIDPDRPSVKRTEAEILANDVRPDVPEEIETAHRRYVALMRRCWDETPSHRPTFRELSDVLSKMLLT